jgi:1-acyl-sn-glycerol-3-phosphate acyltransferase
MFAMIDELHLNDAGSGYDVFGMHRRGVAGALALTRFLYRTWFRVTSHGAEHIPAVGAGILAANHSGLLPFDAAMLYHDVLANTQPPRVARPVADYFVPLLPFVSTLFARAGVVGGSRSNVERLLEDGELVMIFPEGTKGIGKRWAQRYQLQEWRVGHVEMAMRHRAPIVPVAVVGAEEGWPQLARLDSFHLFGAPFLPIPATPVPLPVHYHIHYGEPLLLHERYDGEDPSAVAAASAEVKRVVQALIAEGLASRAGVFT